MQQLLTYSLNIVIKWINPDNLVWEESEKHCFQQFDEKWIHTELSNFWLQILQI